MRKTGNNMIYIVRHGQTEKNKAKQLQGRSDVPLNETGRAQATEVGAWFEKEGIAFDRVYTSPLSRAMETGEIIAPGVPVVVDERLIEMDYGPYEGMDLSDPAPEVKYFFADFLHHKAPEGMEELSNLVSRADSLLQDIKKELQTDGIDKNILLATHAIAMKGALEALDPESQGSYWHKFIGNCAVYVTELLPDGSFAIPRELETTSKDSLRQGQ